MSENKRIGIIGGGLGGMAVSLKLQNQGYQTEVFERRSQLGGLAQGYQEGGYYLEAGPMLWSLREYIDQLIQDAGVHKRVVWYPLDPLFQVSWPDGKQLLLHIDADKQRQQIEEKFPQEMAGFDRYLRLAQDNYEKAFLRYTSRPFFSSLSGIRRVPNKIRRLNYQNIEDFAHKCFKDAQLRQAFSFMSFLTGGSPFHALPSLYPYPTSLVEEKMYYPKGGSQAVIELMKEAMNKAGVKVHFNSEVTGMEFSSEGKQTVKTHDGSHEFDFVISDIDPAQTYKLVQNADEMKEKSLKLTKTQEFTPSLFIILLGVKKKYSQHKMNNIWFGERYSDYFRDIDEYGMIPRDVFCSVHLPAHIDDKLAPKGCETMTIITPVPHMDRLCLEWDVESPKYSERIIRYVEKCGFPDLRDHIEVKRTISPQDFQQNFALPFGSIYSRRPEHQQSFHLRPPNKCRQFKNLFFVGAGTHPGPGLINVLKSSQITSELILKENS